MSVKEDNKDFSAGLKATGLFGSVQIFKILVSVVNTKIVAVLLGPHGVGVLGLLSSTISVITNATECGLSTSAVRDVSNAYGSGDSKTISRIVTVFRRLVWFTGGLGAVICGLFSPIWSKLTFGDYSYTWAFILLSITLLFAQLSAGQIVLLQGTKQFRKIAKAGFWGALLGLVTSTPIYFFFGEKGIVPAMIIVSLSTLILSYLYSKDISVEKVVLNNRDVFREGRIMLKMGLFVAIQGFLNMLFAYIVRVFISRTGSVEDVGIYNAGFNIINTYVGMIFAAIGTEYYPRISAYSEDNNAFTKAVNQQVLLVLLLVAPLIALFLVFCKEGILILYSHAFLGANTMILFGILGVFFKGPSWCLGFTFLAKGDTKAFFWNEASSGFVGLILNVVSYKIWGLTGLGVSFLLWNIYYLIQCYVVCLKRYEYKLDGIIVRVFVPQFIISCIICSCVLLRPGIISYVVGCCLSLISIYLSYKELDKRVGVSSFIKQRFQIRK